MSEALIKGVIGKRTDVIAVFAIGRVREAAKGWHGYAVELAGQATDLSKQVVIVPM